MLQGPEGPGGCVIQVPAGPGDILIQGPVGLGLHIINLAPQQIEVFTNGPAGH